MVTKLKKWNIVISFLMFFIGLNLFLTAIFTGIQKLSYGNSFLEEFSSIMERDYQKTQSFKYYISDYLEKFLCISIDAPIINYYDYFYSENKNDLTAEAETIVEKGIQDNYYYNNYYNSEYSNPEQNKKIAEQYHNSIKTDKNILYCIVKDGKILYQNTEHVTLSDSYDSLPEGYNFLLYFDGKQVKIIKDGIEADVYGSGYYEDNHQWYVPGYDNFPVDSSLEDVRIYMAVAQHPMKYITSNYNNYNSNWQQNNLYWLAYNLDNTRSTLKRSSMYGAIGLLLLLLSMILHKYKRQAHHFIVKFTGKLWYEIKIILLFCVICYVLYTYRYFIQELTWEFKTEGTFYLSFSNILLTLFQHTGAFLTLFWFLYFFFYDAYYNKKAWNHSITRKICHLFNTKALSLPIQKQMILYYCPAFILSLILGTTSIFILGLLCINKNYIGTIWYVLFFIMIFLFSLLIGMQIRYIKTARTFVTDTQLLTEKITSIHNGIFTDSTKLSEDSTLSKPFSELSEIQNGMHTALEEQMKSERMKVELVSNVSHDIKTPLTSIISYVELLNQEDKLPDHVKDYIQILDQKSQRLKSMVQDVFEISKATSKQLPIQLETLDLSKLLRQTLADMSEQIEASNLSIKTTFPEELVSITADGQRLYRVFQNLIQNALKYSLAGSRIYITISVEGQQATTSIKNTSEYELSNKIDFTERFTRGDASRTDGGSGLGLSIARSFTEACGGTFTLECIADLFVVKVSFPITSIYKERSK